MAPKFVVQQKKSDEKLPTTYTHRPLFTTLMRLNLDIWYEIVNYFEYPEDEDILMSLAVTSRCLSDLALDVVWRSGRNNSNIVPVINYFAPSQDEPFLVCSYDNPDEYPEDMEFEGSSSSTDYLIGSWVLNGPLPPAARHRASGYLARIQNLDVTNCRSFSTFGGDEVTVWPILTSLFSHGPILPNLRRLIVSFFAYGRNEYLLPLLSPSLRILQLDCLCTLKHKEISTFLNIAKARGCNLEGLVYSEPPTHEIFEAIMSFKTLQNVSLSRDDDDDDMPELSITIAQLLRSLPALRSLSCYTGLFASSPTDEDHLCHTSLQKIKIKSYQSSLRNLFRVCTFPSVTDVKIVSRKVLNMEGINSSCPNTRKIYLSNVVPGSRTSRPLNFKDIAPLLYLPIESISLSVRKHTLTLSDLSSFAESWPNLRFMKIISSPDFDPLPSLTVFANHRCLQWLDIGLPLPHLFDVIPKIRNLIETDAAARGGSGHSLRSLTLYHNGNGTTETPVTEEDQRILVEFLLRLFPNLEELNFPYDHSSHPHKVELQEILVNMKQSRQKVVVSA